MTTAPVRPAFLYYGAKWRIAPWVIAHFPHHHLYVEPYGGAAGVLLRKPPAQLEVFNDLNGDITDFFKALRDPALLRDIMTRLRLTPYSREEYRAARGGDGVDPAERACRLLIKASMAMGARLEGNAGFKLMLKPAHQIQVAYADDWRRHVENLPRIAERFRSVVIENTGALDLIKRFDRPNTLFYCDPPYVKETRAKTFGEYRRFEMSDEDHARLAETLSGVEGMAVVSGYRCGLYDRLYAGWRREDKETMGGFGKRHVESLWLSPRTSEALTVSAGRAAGGKLF